MRLAVLLALLVGCRGEEPVDDDAAMPVDASDASVPDGDAMVLPTESIEAPPAEIVRAGSGGVLLRGTVLTPDGPIEGEVLAVGTTITCVAADCSDSPAASTVTIVDTHATISPGLIDAHNHASYDFLPAWEPADMQLFENRYDWRDDPDYRAHVAPEAKLESWGSMDPRNRTHMCAALRWAELREIVHGTTTMMGQSPNRTCIHGLVRNADHNHGLDMPNRMRTTISGACEASLSDDDRESLVTAFRSGTATRHAIHMGEGVSGGGVATDPTRELDCYAGRYRASTSLLFDTDGEPFRAALFIHAVPFDDDDLIESMQAGARFVWSPSSNLVLYGRTAPIGRILDLGLPVALGPDWTVSGTGNLLSEMRFALAWASTSNVPAINAKTLVTMATSAGADAVDLAMSIGSLEAGHRADVTVFGRVAADPYRAVIESHASDVRLVLIDGSAYYGDVALEQNIAINGDCDTFDACGAAKFLCAKGTTEVATEGAETIDELETFLRSYLDTGYLDDGAPESFVLDGDDLEPLTRCD